MKFSPVDSRWERIGKVASPSEGPSRRVAGALGEMVVLLAWMVAPSALLAQDPSAGPSRPAPPAAVVPAQPGSVVVPPAPPGVPGEVVVPPGTVVVPPGTSGAVVVPPGEAMPPEPEVTPPVAVPPVVIEPEGTLKPAAPATTTPPTVAPLTAAPTYAEIAALEEPEPEPPVIVSNPFRAALESIFGRTDPAPWHPLPLSTLFTEGWDQPWIGPPNGNRGGPRQGWINSADGNFYRLAFFSYTYTNNIAGGGNGQIGGFTHYQPLSRRLLLISEIPFVTANVGTLAVGKQIFPNPNNTPNHANATGFGDIAFIPRVMLHETDNLSLTAQMAVQVPTGYRPAGNGLAIVTPGIQFWANVSPKWVVRGAFNVAVGTNPQAGGTTLISQLAAGRTFTPHDIPLFGDFTTYLATNTFNDLATGKTTFTLTPGFRTHLGNSYYFLGGLNVPVTGRRPFEEAVTFFFMKVY